MNPISRFFIFLASIVFTAALLGCATNDLDQESELPWNTPQQWEGAPSIPGLNGGGDY